MSHTLTAPAVRRPLRSSPAEAPLRLTARGRVLILIATLAMALAVIGLGQLGGSADAADQGQPSSGPVAQTWVVQPGETLWSIAQSVNPGVDPRDTVARIVDLNDLPDSSVEAGTRIFVPAN